MNYQEFYHRMNEFADLMGLGIRHTKVNVFCYVSKFTDSPEYVKRLWEFVSVRYTRQNFHEIGYVDRNLEWHFKEFNDNVIPERILEEIKSNYADALVAIKSIQLQKKLESIKKDF